MEYFSKIFFLLVCLAFFANLLCCVADVREDNVQYNVIHYLSSLASLLPGVDMSEGSHGEVSHFDYERQGYNWPTESCKPSVPIFFPELSISSCPVSHVWYRGCCEQSPINIDPTTTLVGPNDMNTGLKYTIDLVDYTIFNNGHTIQIDPTNTNSLGKAFLDGRLYEAKQIHFHAPAEHGIGTEATFDGVVKANVEHSVLDFDETYTRRNLEMHIVHLPTEGRGAAVLAITFIPSPTDTPSTFLDALLSIRTFPPASGESITRRSGPALDLSGLVFNQASERIDIYRYYGSLTTPPLTEGVRWMVRSTAVGASIEQLDIFKASMLTIAHGDQGNYRLIQNSPYTGNNLSNVYRVFGIALS